jgi:hypothetical protein
VGKLSHSALSHALNLGRFETEQVLQKHGVTEDMGTIEDYLEDAQMLQKQLIPVVDCQMTAAFMRRP